MSLRFFAGQVGFMKAAGFDVHALTSPGDELSQFGAREGIPVHAVEMPRRISPLHDLGAVRRLAGVMRRLRPHVVHAHTPKGGLLGMLAARAAGVPVRIYHIRGLPFMTATGARRTLLRSTERVACALAQRVLCVSHSLRQVAVDEGVCPPGKVGVLLAGSGNGVDATGAFDPARRDPGERARARAAHGIPDDAVVIGFVGRVVRDKGVVELAAAWSALRARYPELHLLMVGPFEEQDPLPAGVEASLRADPRVHLCGMQPSAAPWYPAMDVVALPTYREGFPNVLLEAAAMGLPVVATRIPGCVDAVREGETGFLVPPLDAAALQAGLDRYLADAELRARHGRQARARVLAEFDQRRLWAALRDEYLRLLDARGLAAESASLRAVAAP
jgi:glycosyltransferase involved in cell wall biosynthesis